MNSVLDISISKEKRPKGRPTNYGNSIYKWPRKYGMHVAESIRNKSWELRNYLPKVSSCQ